MSPRLLACLLLLPAVARAEDVCPADIAKGVAAAKAVLATPHDGPMATEDRSALLCLADAVGKLDAKLSGLANGTIPFDGLYSPNGLTIKKPPTEEGR